MNKSRQDLNQTFVNIAQANEDIARVLIRKQR